MPFSRPQPWPCRSTSWSRAPRIIRRGRLPSPPYSVPPAPATRSAASSPTRSAKRSGNPSSSRIARRRRRIGRALRASSAGRWLQYIDGDQLAALRRSISAQGRELRSGDGLPADRAGGKTLILVIDPKLPPFAQGAGRLCQGPSRHAVVCQRQHRRHRRRRHAGELGRYQHAARAL